MKAKTKAKYRYYKLSFILLVVLAFIYVFLPQLPSFQSSLQIIWRADVAYIVLAVLIFIATYFASAACLCSLAYFKLRYWPTVLVQTADGFTNRLAPAGIGAIATNTLYMKKQSRSGLKAGYVAVLNNLIGLVIHLILLLVLLLVSQSFTQDLFQPRHDISRSFVLIVPILALLAGLFWYRLKPASIKKLKRLGAVAALSLEHPWRLLSASCFAVAITVLYALTLVAVMLALNVHITLLQTFLVFTASVIASVITPTPGGLGGVEASLVAILVAFGIAPGPALSVALVYRLITYWLPILPGAVALEIVIKRGYLTRAKT